MEAHRGMSSTALANDGAALSADEIAAYRRNDYVIPGLRISATRLAELEDAADYVRDNDPHVPPELLMSVHIVDNEAEGRRGHRTFLDIALDAALLDLVAQVIGPNIVLWGCHLFYKPGETGHEVPWHQDSHFWPFRPLATCTIWLALDKVDGENGCMRVIPGSQTEVKPEQYFARMKFAKRLEQYFAAIEEPHRIHYERRDGQYDRGSEIKTRVITSTNVIRSFAAMYLEKPHRTTRGYTGLRGRVGSDIFGENHRLEPYYAAAYAHYLLETRFRTKSTPA